MTSNAPPLVLHVIHHLVVGGMENGLVNLINRMPPQRFRHAIACVEDYSEFRQRLRRPDVEVIAMHRSRIGVWALRRQVFDLCRRLRPTVLHTRGQSGLDALLPARLSGVRHSVHGEHGWDVNDLSGRAWKPVALRRLHSPLVNRYITVSKDIEHYLVHRVGISASRITQIYNGVDTERYSPVSAKPVALLPQGFAAAHAFVIGTVGRIQAVKDQATLVRAFAALAGRDADSRRRLRLVIVGDGPLLPDLKQLVETLGIADICWLPGAVTDTAEVMQALDVFVLPSLNEGISNTILEAMACGLPVLASAVGGNPELVEAERNGRLFAPGDVQALTRLLADYLVDPELARQHAHQARVRVVEHFGLDAMVSRYQAVYEQLCSAASSRPAER
jgi:sugar transferase (PEP-CTERM/EpsH1 system associated)